MPFRLVGTADAQIDRFSKRAKRAGGLREPSATGA
jgi:hypothetical protein